MGLIMGSPVLAGGIIMTCYRIGMGRTAATLPDEIAAARREGVPLQVSELQRLATPSEMGENAAPLYRKAAGLFSQSGRLETSLTQLLGGSASAKDIVEIRDRMPSFDDAAAVVTEAVAKQRVDWQRRWALGDEIDFFTDYQQLRSLASLLCTRAVLSARAGQLDKALDEVSVALRIADHAGREPTMYAFTSGAQIESDCLATLDHVLNRRQPTLAQIDRAIDIVRALPDLPNLRERFAFETGMCYTVLSRPVERPEIRRYDADDDFNERSYDHIDRLDLDPSKWIEHSQVYRDAGAAKALHYARRCLERIPRKNATFEQFSAAFSKLSAELDEDRSLESGAVSYQFPNAGGVLSEYTSTVMNRRLTRQALAVLRYVTVNRHAPAALPLTGEDLIDPHSGKPLGYRINPREFRVYSVGPDHVDNGGITHAEKKKGTYDYDIVRSFPFPTLGSLSP
jgi:hypothetical protein